VPRPEPGWAARPLDQLPRIVADGEPDWVPLQHLFGITAFGANVFRSSSAGDELVGEHDERGSGQEELYLVVGGRATFTIAGEEVQAPAMSAIAIRDPTLLRRAVAAEPGTVLVALGGLPRPDFRSTWRAEHFEGIEPIL
jgi:hypothetical protein